MSKEPLFFQLLTMEGEAVEVIKGISKNMPKEYNHVYCEVYNPISTKVMGTQCNITGIWYEKKYNLYKIETDLLDDDGDYMFFKIVAFDACALCTLADKIRNNKVNFSYYK